MMPLMGAPCFWAYYRESGDFIRRRGAAAAFRADMLMLLAREMTPISGR